MNLIQFARIHRGIFLYVFFGALTTIVNVVVYYLCAHPLDLGEMTSVVISWIASVYFAYVTNRKWVFHSSRSGFHDILIECFSFYGARLTTGIIDFAIMYLFVVMLDFDDVIVKIISNIIVIILNYIASKVIIFKNNI